MTSPPRRVLVLGGGSAGWMTACLMQHRWGARGTAVTVVESPEIGIIGVGEGSTPQLKHFFDTLGLSEADWMPRAHATVKAGIDFVGWSDREGFGRYHHPFAADTDRKTAPPFFYNTRARRTGRDVPAHPDAFFLNSRLATERRDPSRVAGASYGYHFDAHELGALMREWAVARGVSHRTARVVRVERGSAGDVVALHTDDGERLAANLFVDASGFRAVLMADEPFVSYADALFNDRAVTIATPVTADCPVHTTATALSAGWAWSIPLTHRTACGYVYSSRFLNGEGAEAELRHHLHGASGQARHLSYRVGRRSRSWAGNVLAVGLAQGFLEPLEATALHLVLSTVEGFLLTGGDPMARDQFNAAIARRYDGVRDYIVAHYRLAGRRDTGFWRAATGHDHLSSSLKRLMTTWFRGEDLGREIAEQGIGDIYSAASWHCLFAGYGTYPDDAKLRPPGVDITPADIGAIQALFSDRIARCFL